MTGVEDRVVSMQFDNDVFERRLSATLTSLDKLSESLKFAGAEKGFGDISNAADNVDLSNMASSLDDISSKFSALGAIAFSVIQSITQSVFGFVTNLASEDILGPIITGGKKRAINIEQAKFMFRGLGIDVAAGMQSALDAVLGTAFGLDEAAKAAAQFGASGIQVGSDMTAALRGVAGAAAMTGTSFTEMADIFAGSAGTGKVTNMDLMQFATRGLNAAAAIGKVLGKTEAQIHEMAAAGQLDFKTFASAMDEAFGAHATEANQTYTGALSNLHAAMSRMGASFFGERLTQERDLFNALTPVVDLLTKALKPLTATFLRFSEIGTGNLINFLNSLSNVGGFIENFTGVAWNFASAIQTVFAQLGKILGAAKEAFRDIFPKSEVSNFLLFSAAVRDLSEKMKIGEHAIRAIKDIFKGIFSIFSIGIAIVKEIGGLFIDLFSAIREGTSGGSGEGPLAFFGKIGQFLTDLKIKLVDAGGIHDFFLKLRDVIAIPIEFIGKLKDKITEFFNVSPNSSGINGAFDTIKSHIDSFFNSSPDTSGLNRAFDGLESHADALSNVWDRFSERMGKIFEILAGISAYIITWFGELGGKIAEAFKPGDFDAAVDIINAGLLGGLVIMVKKFLDGDFTAFGTGLVAKINGIIDGITGTLQTMQTKLKAETLEKIAIAMLALTGSIVILSMIDSVNLTKALTAITIGFSELGAMMFLMDKFVGSTGAAAKLSVTGAALIEFAIAMDILSLSIAFLSRLDLTALGKGLLGVGVGLGLLVITTQLITADTAGLIAAGTAMMAISVALFILSGAVKAFSTLSWADMATGLVGIAGGLTAIVLAMNLMPIASTLAAGAAMIPLAIGLTILAGAVKLFSVMSWEEMGRGLGGIALGLGLIALTMKFMPLSMPITAAGLVILAGALIIMAEAVKLMGTMDLGTLAKGIGSITILLLILDAAMASMEGALPGAAALIVVSGALLILTNVLAELGKLSIAQLITGIVSIAGVLLLLAGMSLLLSPLIPEMLALGVAVGLLGAGMALMGGGIFLMAKGLETLATSGVAGLSALVTAIPEIVRAFFDSVLNMGQDLLNAVPLLLRLVTAVLEQLFDTIIKLAPKFGEALVAIVSEGLKFLRDTYPDFVKTGFEMFMAFLNGIRDNIGEIVKTVADITIKFINALTEKVPEFVDSVYNFILTVAEELAKKLGQAQTAFIPIGKAFIDGILTGVEDAFPGLINWFTELPGKILDVVKSLLGIDSPSSKFVDIGVNIITGLLNGLIDTVINVMTWFIELPGKILGWVGDAASWLKDNGIQAIVGFLQGIGEKEIDILNWFVGLPGQILGWIGDVSEKLKNTGIDFIKGLFFGITEKVWDVITWFGDLPELIVTWLGDTLDTLKQAGVDLITGLINGIASMIPGLEETSGAIAGSAADAFKKKAESKSPSRVFHRLGINVVEGLINGFNSMRKAIKDASVSLADQVINGFDPNLSTQGISSVMSTLMNQLDSMDNFNPVITPVLDLSKVEAASSNLERFMRLSPITPDVSLNQARLISTTADTTKSVNDVPVNTGPNEVKFEQNIYAPEALSTNDIYRNTKSQIALAKEELGIS